MDELMSRTSPTPSSLLFHEPMPLVRRPHFGDHFKVAGPLAALLIAGAHVHAECIRMMPCNALAESSVVALVEVLDVAAEPGVDYGVQVAHLRVIERFKGVPEAQRVILVKLEIGVESKPFESGKRYIVYAYQKPDGLWGGICQTRVLVDENGDDLKQLRRCRGK